MAEAFTKKPRDPWFDNSRWLAGTLVVVIHTIEGYLDVSPAAGWLYVASWAIRVPLFAILVGYFSASIPLGTRDVRKLIRTVVLPLVFVSLLHILPTAILDGDVDSPAEPQYTLWFLYGVIIWRVILPYLSVLRWPVLVGFLLAIGAGFTEAFGDEFALSRVMGFLPFFMVGWWLSTNDGWLRARSSRSTAIAIAVVLGVVALATVLNGVGLLDRQVVGMMTTYNSPTDALLRLAVVVCALAMALAVMHLLPRRRVPFMTKIGQAGFFIYLLHGLVLRALRLVGVLPDGTDPQPWELPALIVFGVLLAALLGSPLVTRLTRPIVQPKADWLFREPAPALEPVPGQSR